MAFGGAEIFLMMAMFGGGLQVNDLVSLVQLDAYWQAQGVEVTAENMTGYLSVKTGQVGDISELVKQLGDDRIAVREAAERKIRQMGKGAIPQLQKAAKTGDLEIASRIKKIIGSLTDTGGDKGIRRLMAVRTLGERKIKQALPQLRELTGSKDPFLAEYAKRAVAQIEGKSYTPPMPTADQLEQDLWMMPAKMAIVGRVRVSGGQTFDIAKMIQNLPAQLRGMMQGPQLQQMTQEMNQQILMVANTLGNARVDAVTFAISGDAGPDGGFAVVVIRGLCDMNKLKATLKAQAGLEFDKRQGMDFALIEKEGSLALVSNDRMAFIYGPDQQKVPMETILSSLKDGQGTLNQNTELAKLIKSVNKPENTTWIAGRPTDSLKKEEPFDRVESFAVTMQESKDLMKFKLDAVGTTADMTKQTVDEINQGLKEAKEQLKDPNAAGMMPKEMTDLLNSIKVSHSDKQWSVSGQMKGGMTSMMMMGMAPMMMLRGGAAQPAPVQPRPAPAPPRAIDRAVPAPQKR